MWWRLSGLVVLNIAVIAVMVSGMTTVQITFATVGGAPLVGIDRVVRLMGYGAGTLMIGVVAWLSVLKGRQIVRRYRQA